MPYDRNSRINVDTSSYIEWELFFQGYYERWVIEAMKKIIKKGDVAIDAGANIGSHTLIMAKLVGNAGRVLAFDPDLRSVRRLKENLDLNHFSNTKVFQSALSNKAGTMTLFLYGDEARDQGTVSLYNLPKLQKSEVEVSVETLDEIVKRENLSRLNFIKIDTRGSDLNIIKGARASINKFQPVIVFEYNKDNWDRSRSKWSEARQLFSEDGYALYLIDKNGIHFIEHETDGKTSYNILALPKEKINQINLKLS